MHSLRARISISLNYERYCRELRRNAHSHYHAYALFDVFIWRNAIISAPDERTTIFIKAVFKPEIYFNFSRARARARARAAASARPVVIVIHQLFRPACSYNTLPLLIPAAAAAATSRPLSLARARCRRSFLPRYFSGIKCTRAINSPGEIIFTTTRRAAHNPAKLCASRCEARRGEARLRARAPHL